MESIPKTKIDRLSEIAEKSAENLGLTLLRIHARGTPSRAIIEVIIDGPRLVKISDCEIVSKKLNEEIESESLISGNFRLDVLSPGLDEPIIHNYQFQKTIGHLVEIEFEDDVKKGTISGILIAVSMEEVIITPRQFKRSSKIDKQQDVHIKKSTIRKALARPDMG